MAATQLGYIGFHVRTGEALAQWRTLAEEVLGCEVREEDGSLYLKVDERHHRIALHPGERDGVAYIGWEVDAASELAELAQSLRGIGIAAREGSADQKRDRRVGALLCFDDPSGFPVEVYASPELETGPSLARAAGDFNTGALGLGHAVLVAKDAHALAEFYTSVLGLRISDYIAAGELDAIFLHCNPRHHSLAISNECYGLKQGQMQHFMLEVKSLDNVGYGYDRANELNVVWLTLGKHTNDHMLSFYFQTPSGVAIEYGCDGRTIDDDEAWRVEHYSATSRWGHTLVA